MERQDGAQDNEDDLDLEVTDLRTGALVTSRACPRRQRAFAPAAASAVAAADADDLTCWFDPSLTSSTSPYSLGRVRDLRSPLPDRARRQRRHLLGTLALVPAVLLTLAVALSTVPGGLQTALALVHATPPLPTPAEAGHVPPGSNLLYLRHSVPWGSLVIDGQAVPQASAREAGSIFSVLVPGRHSIEYQAAPFPPLSCALSVPPVAADTCPVGPYTGDEADAGVPQSALRLLDLGATPARLPAAQRVALLAATQQALTTATTSARLPAGDHYTVADGAPREAAGPLATALRVALSTDGAGEGGPCLALCHPTVVYDRGALAWSLSLSVRLSWAYTPARPDTPDAGERSETGPAAPTGTPPAVLATAEVAWDGTWHVSVPLLARPNRILCALAGAWLRARPALSPSEVDLTLVPADAGEAGCVVFVRQQHNTQTPDGTRLAVDSRSAVLLRFGVMLAADPAAHALLPDLPLASPHEQSIMQRLRAEQPVT